MCPLLRHAAWSPSPFCKVSEMSDGLGRWGLAFSFLFSPFLSYLWLPTHPNVKTLVLHEVTEDTR